MRTDLQISYQLRYCLIDLVKLGHDRHGNVFCIRYDTLDMVAQRKNNRIAGRYLFSKPFHDQRTNRSMTLMVGEAI